MTQIVPAAGTMEPEPTLLWIALAIGVILGLGASYHFFARGRTSAEARGGLALGLRGLISKELRSRSRGWRPALLLTGYLGALSVAMAGFLAVAGSAGGVVSPVVGTQLFSALAVGSVLLLAFITPALTVGAISGERERRTLDLLLVTRSSALGLVSGKLLGSLFYVLFLMVASLPAFAMVYLFGGVPPLYLGMVLAVAAVTAVAHAALGLLLSVLLRRTLVATVVAYLLVLTLVLGLPFVSAILGISRQMQRGELAGSGPLPVYLYASPLVSLSSVLPTEAVGSGVPLAGDILRAIVTGGRSGFMAQPGTVSITKSVYVAGMNPATGQVEPGVTWAPWIYHFLLSGLFSVLCLLISAAALAPPRLLRIRKR